MLLIKFLFSRHHEASFRMQNDVFCVCCGIKKRLSSEYKVFFSCLTIKKSLFERKKSFCCCLFVCLGSWRAFFCTYGKVFRGLSILGNQWLSCISAYKIKTKIIDSKLNRHICPSPNTGIFTNCTRTALLIVKYLIC